MLGDDARRVGRQAHPALSRVLPLPVADFAQAYWGRAPLFARAAELAGGPDGFHDLLSLDAVDGLLGERGLRTPFLRLAKDGQVIDPAGWTGPGGAGAEIADQVRDEAVMALFADGASIVLQGLHRTHPPLVAFAGSLAEELGHPVQVNAYVTPPQSRGFDAHYDVHDVFVLQVAGEKRWRISAPVLEAPLRSQPWTDRRPAVAARAGEPPVLDEVLRPGDVLYLPRGWLHAAEALGDVSAHVTVGIHTVTRYALVEALTGLAAADPELRRSLPLGVDVADPEALRDELADTLSALVDQLRATPAEAVVERLRRAVWPRSRPAPLAPLAQAAALRATGPATVVRLRPGLRATLADAGGELAVLLTGRRVLLPGTCRGAVQGLLDGGTLTAASLAGELGLDPALELVRRLLREAIAVPA